MKNSFSENILSLELGSFVSFKKTNPIRFKVLVLIQRNEDFSWLAAYFSERRVARKVILLEKMFMALAENDIAVKFTLSEIQFFPVMAIHTELQLMKKLFIPSNSSKRRTTKK